MRGKIFAALMLTATLLLTGCGGDTPAKTASGSEVTLKVGATPVPHAEILEEIKPNLKEQGIKLEIVEFNDNEVRGITSSVLQSRFAGKDISMLSEQLLLSGEWSVDIVSLFSTETKTKMVFPAEVNIIHCSIKRFDRKETFRYLKAFLKECENKYEYLMTFHSEISSFVSLLRKRKSQMKWIATEHISMDFYTKKRRILNLVSY